MTPEETPSAAAGAPLPLRSPLAASAGALALLLAPVAEAREGSRETVRFRAGQWVEVRTPQEIFATLSPDGTLEGLPFMPEMLQWAGRPLRVLRRAEKTCVDGSEDGIRSFRGGGVVLLEGVRCDGAAHEGCGRACMIFWKEAWLREAAAPGAAPLPDAPASSRELPTRRDGRFFCQSSEIDAATEPLPRWRRLLTCVRDVRLGNRTPLEMVSLVWRPLWAKVLEKVQPRHPIGPLRETPAAVLGLQPGEWVEVRSFDEICATLDANGRNRGLQFSRDLAGFCGRRFQVRSRLDRMIIERQGRMLNVSHTVILEGIQCPCRCVIGGCPRADLIYWREIWLRRVEGPAAAA